MICDRGAVARKAKGSNVLAGGAGGMILAEVGIPGIDAVLVDTHVLLLFILQKKIAML